VSHTHLLMVNSDSTDDDDVLVSKRGSLSSGRVIDISRANIGGGRDLAKQGNLSLLCLLSLVW